jgi:SNF2 family DNA or RNA helicase
MTQSTSAGIPWSPQEYQVEGIKMLLEQGAVALFLDPGLGKTSLVLAALKILKARTLINKVLIVAPIRPMYKVWPDEVAKWADFNHFVVSILHGPNKEWNFDAEADLYIVNPEGLKWLLQKDLSKLDVLVIDESTKFKSHASQRFKLLKPLLNLFKRRWILTGTPSPNGLEGLFSQMYILDLGRALGRFITHFRRDYFYQSGWSEYDISPKPGAFEQIVERISPLVYQLSAEDHLKMPKLVFKSLEVTLPPEAMKLYKSFERHNIVVLPSGVEIVADTEGVLSGRLHQMANGAIYTNTKEVEFEVIHDEKLDTLESYIEELSGKPTLVIYEFQHDLIRLRSRLGVETPCLGKGTSIKGMEIIVDKFNAGSIPVLLSPQQSGLNLQGSCHHIIWFDIPWDLEYYDQTIARVYRQGQQSDTVFVHHIVAKGTKDEDILLVLDEKDKLQQSLMRALK